MKPRILTALKGSIKKWEKIVKGTGRDLGRQNCPLCQAALIFCIDCPVPIQSGNILCYKTPYYAWVKHHRNIHASVNEPFSNYGIIENCEECKKLAQSELDFLISLLPKK